MKKRVLIICKDRAVRDELRMALYDENIIVNFADSPMAVEEILKEGQYCLMIWDMQQEILICSYNAIRLGKPVDTEVCVEQICSIIRNGQRAEKRCALLSFGDELVIDWQHHITVVGGIQLSLTPTEFALLYYMAMNPGQVFSYKQLYMHIWGDVPDLGMEKTVKVHLSNLRKKFNIAGKDYIQNVRGVGYRFIPPTIANSS